MGKQLGDVKEVKRTDDVLVFKITKPVSKQRFDLIDAMVRDQEKKSGIKIVLMPFSVEEQDK